MTFSSGMRAAAVLAVLALAGNAMAISVTLDTNAMNLANTATQFGGAGLTVTAAVLQGHNAAGIASSGTYTNASLT